MIWISMACATVPPPESLPAAAQSEKLASLKYEIFSGETQAGEVVAGALAVIRLTLPPVENQAIEIMGEFQGKKFPFFLTDSLKGPVFETLVGIPYDMAMGPTKLIAHLTLGSTVTDLQIPLQVKAGNYASEILHVDRRRVNPTRPSDLRRIRREQQDIGDVYRRVTLQKMWKGPFTLPIASSVTSPYGTRRVYNGVLKSFHTGLDLKAPMNTPIYAAAPGVVALSKNLFYTGNTIILDHGYGVMTVYAHMNVRKVKVGQTIGPHELIGLSGKTGRVNGPHLHWQGIVHQVKVNPLGLVQVLK